MYLTRRRDTFLKYFKELASLRISEDTRKDFNSEGEEGIQEPPRNRRTESSNALYSHIQNQSERIARKMFLVNANNSPIDVKEISKYLSCVNKSSLDDSEAEEHLATACVRGQIHILSVARTSITILEEISNSIETLSICIESNLKDDDDDPQSPSGNAEQVKLPSQRLV